MNSVTNIRRGLSTWLVVTLLATAASLLSANAAQADPYNVWTWGIPGPGDYSAGRKEVRCAPGSASITGASPLVSRAPTGTGLRQRIEMWPFLRKYVGNNHWDLDRWGTPQAFYADAPNGVAPFLPPVFSYVQSGAYIAGYRFRWYETRRGVDVMVGEAEVHSGYGDYYWNGNAGPYYCIM